MTVSDSMKFPLDLEDVMDWAFCPLRVWWKRGKHDSKVADVGSSCTADGLVRQSILAAIRLYYRAVRKRAEFTFEESLGLIWRKWLNAWNLSDILARPLVDYQHRRRSLLCRFKAATFPGQNGAGYRSLMRTRQWRELAESHRLSNLRRFIDSQAKNTGLEVIGLPDREHHGSPIGLADAYSDSVDMAAYIRLPEASSVIGVGVPMVVDLPSVSLNCRADIVREIGRSRGVGRPSKDPKRTGGILKLETILLIFDEEFPSLQGLARDLRILAFGKARLDPHKHAERNIVERVSLYHLPSGEHQDFTPRLHEGLELLDSISSSVLTGMHQSVYVPRMVCGREICGGCEYYVHCFSATDVMEVFAATPMAHVDASHPDLDRLMAFMIDNFSSVSRVDDLRAILEFMVKSGSSPEGLLWLLEKIEAERS